MDMEEGVGVKVELDLFNLVNLVQTSQVMIHIFVDSKPSFKHINLFFF